MKTILYIYADSISLFLEFSLSRACLTTTPIPVPTYQWTSGWPSGSTARSQSYSLSRQRPPGKTLALTSSLALTRTSLNPNVRLALQRIWWDTMWKTKAHKYHTAYNIFWKSCSTQRLRWWNDWLRLVYTDNSAAVLPGQGTLALQLWRNTQNSHCGHEALGFSG